MKECNLTFEAEVCARCWGTGEYSYCQMHGKRCFKCSGKGHTLTKRGQAAQEYFNQLNRVNPSELIEGERVRVPYVHGTTVVGTFISVVDSKIKVLVNGENMTIPVGMVAKVVVFRDREAKMQEALAYQATLTKQGKPLKKGKKDSLSPAA